MESTSELEEQFNYNEESFQIETRFGSDEYSSQINVSSSSSSQSQPRRQPNNKNEEIWSNFTVTESSRNKRSAICNFCNYPFNWAKVERLRLHLLKCKGTKSKSQISQSFHQTLSMAEPTDLDNNELDFEEPEEDSYVSTVDSIRLKRHIFSEEWKNFTITEWDNGKMLNAFCNHCKKAFKWPKKQRIRQHLFKCIGKVFVDPESSYSSKPPNQIRTSKSREWSNFTVTQWDGGKRIKAFCNHCKKSFKWPKKQRIREHLIKCIGNIFNDFHPKPPELTDSNEHSNLNLTEIPRMISNNRTSKKFKAVLTKRPFKELSSKIVWSYFKLICFNIGGEKQIACKLCNSTFKQPRIERLRTHVFKCLGGQVPLNCYNENQNLPSNSSTNDFIETFEDIRIPNTKIDQIWSAFTITNVEDLVNCEAACRYCKKVFKMPYVERLSYHEIECEFFKSYCHSYENPHVAEASNTNVELSDMKYFCLLCPNFKSIESIGIECNDEYEWISTSEARQKIVHSLCQTLDIPPIFQHDLSKAPFCNVCSDKIEKVHHLISQMEEIQNQILFARFHIESLFVMRQEAALNSSNDQQNSESNFRLRDQLLSLFYNSNNDNANNDIQFEPRHLNEKIQQSDFEPGVNNPFSNMGNIDSNETSIEQFQVKTEPVEILEYENDMDDFPRPPSHAESGSYNPFNEFNTEVESLELRRSNREVKKRKFDDDMLEFDDELSDLPNDNNESENSDWDPLEAHDPLAFLDDDLNDKNYKPRIRVGRPRKTLSQRSKPMQVNYEELKLQALKNKPSIILKKIDEMTREEINHLMQEPEKTKKYSLVKLASLRYRRIKMNRYVSCGQCGEKFRKDRLSNHLARHAQGIKIRAAKPPEYEEERQKRKSEFDKLQMPICIRNGKRFYICIQCGKEVRYDRIFEHLDKHERAGEVIDLTNQSPEMIEYLNSRKYDEQSNCEICGKTMKTVYLAQHILRHEYEELSGVIKDKPTFYINGRRATACEVCKKPIRNDRILDHILSHDGLSELTKNKIFEYKKKRKAAIESIKLTLSTRFVKVTPVVKQGRMYYPCEHCEKDIRSDRMAEHLLSKHREGFNRDGSETDEEIEGQPEVPKTKMIQYQHKIRKRKNFYSMCEQCGKLMKSGALRNHLLMHDRYASFPFVCSYEGCGKRFITEDKEKEHFNQKHDETKKVKFIYNCSVCERNFHTQLKLWVHKKLIHSIIEGEIKYPCNSCELTFETRQLMRNHVREIHAPSFTHQCHICGIKVRTDRCLKGHMTTHSDYYPYICEFEGCNKKYKRRGGFNIHVRSHTGVRPYKCSVCDKAFKDSWKLANHEPIHSGKKHYNCNICGENFPVQHYLYMHKKKKHGIGGETSAREGPKRRRRNPGKVVRRKRGRIQISNLNDSSVSSQMSGNEIESSSGTGDNVQVQDYPYNLSHEQGASTSYIPNLPFGFNQFIHIPHPNQPNFSFTIDPQNFHAPHK